MGYGYTPKIDYIPISEMIKDNEENNTTKMKNFNFKEKTLNSTIDLDEDSDDGNMIIKNNISTKNNPSKKNELKKENIEKCNLVWKRKFVTPSIPYKNLTYGFIENKGSIS